MTSLKELYDKPLLELISYSHNIHNQNNNSNIQKCHLISIKTGGCSEDCKYCSQSSYNKTNIQPQKMLSFETVITQAKKAVKEGATRICLGAAWRNVKNNHQFQETLKMVKSIAELDVEVCCTLGMIDEEQAEELRKAGLFAYNHNLDSSEKFYKTIITTRSYQDRLTTLNTIEKVGLKVCCGSIIGMGEEIEDRLEFLLTLLQRGKPPESIPINLLMPIAGTPLEQCEKVDFWELLRLVAVTRIVFPQSKVRLSAGRIYLSYEQQLLCFFAGANSLWIGEKLLTACNPNAREDEQMFELFFGKDKE